MMSPLAIEAVTCRFEDVPLTRPYTISRHSADAVTLGFVEVHAGGLVGRGSASPAEEVTGESYAACKAALAPDRLRWLIGEDARRLPALGRRIDAAWPRNPAARAALDIALHDLLAQALGLPLVDMLGRSHEALPTSITIGIKSIDEAVDEAHEYRERGFMVWKVKLGHSVDDDLARLAALRRTFGSAPTLRVDPNQGYSPAELRRFDEAAAELGIEFVEQPCAVAADAQLRALPEPLRERLAADESLLGERAALDLSAPPRPFGTYNIKLMKCGGIRPALRIATIAEAGGIALMWGCNDESRISIAAALHAAFASPATRYLDLDGSLDLAHDAVTGGFTLEQGIMRTLDAPGLGVRTEGTAH